jgi:hypothetical protein
MGAASSNPSIPPFGSSTPSFGAGSAPSGAPFGYTALGVVRLLRRKHPRQPTPSTLGLVGRRSTPHLVEWELLGFLPAFREPPPPNSALGATLLPLSGELGSAVPGRGVRDRLPVFLVWCLPLLLEGRPWVWANPKATLLGRLGGF